MPYGLAPITVSSRPFFSVGSDKLYLGLITLEDTCMNITRRWVSGIAIVLLMLVASVSVVFGQDARGRWDIVSVDFAASPVTVSAGGVAAALANDGSIIKLTGSGTFTAFDPTDVTGGGTWETSGPVGTARGTYAVTELVQFEEAPGTPNPANIDNIGDPADAHAGLVVLRIAYSDGSRGILVVSCGLTGTPNTVFEGVTASKDFVDFWQRVPAVPGIATNRTLFHVQ
jgi:hypothetical protein